MLKTEIIGPTQVSYTTRLWELPETARCEITQLQYFINQQRDKQNKVNEQLHSLCMPMIKNIQTKIDNVNIVRLYFRSFLIACLTFFVEKGSGYFIQET